ncbi:hypothetical protein VCRA2116O29_210052 [Vibrio crassostreae]|nr:hypothetical protein VCRA2119O48_100031 [Vibrio crassostreae]CAK2436182.1 hypothetical protein VCRA2116O29_210052 [Vibrio crassostreae]CAK3833576.1 hypothetical protein VCRA212O16_200060 [Vibrio crassostreae]CAK3891415.1 hypothetical protein VCRA2123O74_60031 [Vibrio crassostreae]
MKHYLRLYPYRYTNALKFSQESKGVLFSDQDKFTSIQA